MTARKHPDLPTGVSARILVPSQLVFDYELKTPAAGPPRELVVLLHGFQDRGDRMFRKLAGCLPDDVAVLAPNAPFPMAYRKGENHEISYSWYFYHPATDEYFIDMAIGIEFLRNGIASLGYANLPKRLIGFSQGGYLAPIAAQALGGVRQVIGIGCGYLMDEIPGKIEFRVDGLHGTADGIVDPANAGKSHARLLSERGVSGAFHLLDSTGHRIDEKVRAKVRELVLTA